MKVIITIINEKRYHRRICILKLTWLFFPRLRLLGLYCCCCHCLFGCFSRFFPVHERANDIFCFYLAFFSCRIAPRLFFPRYYFPHRRGFRRFFLCFCIFLINLNRDKSVGDGNRAFLRNKNFTSFRCIRDKKNIVCFFWLDGAQKSLFEGWYRSIGLFRNKKGKTSTFFLEMFNVISKQNPDKNTHVQNYLYPLSA